MTTQPAADCPFCDQLGRIAELPAEDVVWQFPHAVAFLGRWQYYQGYCVLAARRHATELSQLSDTERRAYLDEMCQLARAIERCFQPRKLNYELLGNQVPHLHWHVFPRYADDPEFLQPVWLALSRADQDERERQRLLAGRLDRSTIGARIREQFIS